MTEEIMTYWKQEDSENPGFFRVRSFQDGSVLIAIRKKPVHEKKGFYVCSYERDKGRPGRCTPGGSRCNNYCNMAPEKGPVAAHPMPYLEEREGDSIQLVLEKEEWEKLLEEVFRRFKDV